MALLSTYSAANRVLWQDKTVTYEDEIVPGYWSKGSTVGTLVAYDKAWQITRQCTMSYSYVGMDLATAQRCASDLVALFNRTTVNDEWKPNVSDTNFTSSYYGNVPMATVTVNKTVGRMYQVDVNVNEFDQRMQIFQIGTPGSNLSSYFSFANSRSYYLP